MKLLFVSNFYPPHHLGGYEMLCHEVARHLIARGHDLTVLTSTHGAEADEKEPRIYRELVLDCNVHYYRPHQVLSYFSTRRTNRQALERAMIKTAPDIVVIWGMWQLSRQVAAWAEELAGPKIAYYISDQWPAEPGSHRDYWDRASRSLIGRVFKGVLRIPVRLALQDEWRPPELQLQHTMVCSRAVRDKLLEAGVRLSHAKVIYHGIDPTPYRQAAEQHSAEPASTTLRVAYVGTLAPHKGVHTAVEALGQLTKLGTPAELAILGSGHPEYERRLHELVERWQLDGRVTFHRPIPRAKLPTFLAQHDVLVMPSVYEEPQARISQEAMAAGPVLVATLTGGTKELLIDGENGLAFEPEDADGLARQLDRLAQDPELCQELRSHGWQTVKERFTITRMIDELEAYLIQIAAP